MPAPIASPRALELDAIRRGATRLATPLAPLLTPQEISTDTIATAAITPLSSSSTSRALAPRTSPLTLPAEHPEFDALLQEHMEIASQEANLPLQSVKSAFSTLASAELSNAISKSLALDSWQATSAKLFPNSPRHRLPARL